MEQTIKEVAEQKGLSPRTDEHNDSECFGVTERADCYWLWTNADHTHYVVADLATED